MANLNKQWLLLIGILIATLIVAVGWEGFQIVTNGRDEFRSVESPLSNDELISDVLINHLQGGV